MKTRHDGWECVPELKEAVNCIDQLNECIYEIKHCVRASSTADLKNLMLQNLREAIELLECIDEDIEYETIYED
jgi:hypothetical protein